MREARLGLRAPMAQRLLHTVQLYVRWAGWRFPAPETPEPPMRRQALL